jgi:hypothetical protein
MRATTRIRAPQYGHTRRCRSVMKAIQRRNPGEPFESTPDYAASRISQLRKSSSAARHARNIKQIRDLRRPQFGYAYKPLHLKMLRLSRAALDDVRNWLETLCVQFALGFGQRA